jgi:hypothetical protein
MPPTCFAGTRRPHPSSSPQPNGNATIVVNFLFNSENLIELEFMGFVLCCGNLMIQGG